ncbi:D-alanine--D-alanine ligase [Gluconobacter japonicus]|uniref:D-alanine--D-alanine ligase n=1 Tax=Gluconobacter japonicus TaxID=376620 RepID=A0ABQ5WH55_GLUJA|nr:D-alanine--D-alanine ligase [Gluconobacter japonicus]KXV24229.1 D-alanine--D-alanine ligase [Gluconobacter japonicus]GBR21489.1 D-alanine--D-alanine ligase [Gluconobacter japonicus NBRC 3271]GLQ59409.1 D-alanine--D-alanine ligase [Gluconobacter japonicus]
MKVAVLYGGTSSERPVSLVSGEAAISALREKGHDVTPVDVGSDIAVTIQALKAAAPDVVFNALHGPKGEDGAIQGVLEWLGMPYTHSGIRASAVAMDKGATRILLAAAGLPVAEGRVVTVAELAEADPLPVPYVIKPVAEGSSVGVEIIRAGDNRRAEIARTWRFGKEALAESFIPGRELTAGVMGNRALAVTDILPAETAAFYDFEAKYKAGGSRHVVPADLPADVTERALDYALRAHQTLGCAGASRTDFRYDDETDTLIILEVNTQPGMTPTSLLPEQAAYCGISYPDLCDWMVQEALNR